MLFASRATKKEIGGAWPLTELIRFWIYSGNGPEIIRLQDMAKSHMRTILMWSAKHLERKTSGPTSPS